MRAEDSRAVSSVVGPLQKGQACFHFGVNDWLIQRF